MTPTGLPHSEIPGSKRVNRSPWLIAACRVLHRLPMPRHPPLALSSLSIKPDKTNLIKYLVAKPGINSATVTSRYPWSSYKRYGAVARILRPVHPPPWRIWVTLLFDCQRPFQKPETRSQRTAVRCACGNILVNTSARLREPLKLFY